VGGVQVRVMPNTPCLIGQAASAYVLGNHATHEDAAKIYMLLSSAGERSAALAQCTIGRDHHALVKAIPEIRPACSLSLRQPPLCRYCAWSERLNRALSSIERLLASQVPDLSST